MHTSEEPVTSKSPSHRSYVRFSATRQLILYPNEAVDSLWYSNDDIVSFKREMLEQVYQLRRVEMGRTHHNPERFFSSEENVAKCTGIMTFVLSDRSMLVRLRGMNLAHVDKVVEEQDDLKPLELSYVARKSSYDAQMRALVLASLCRERESMWRPL